MKALNSHFIMTFVLSLLCIYSFSQEVRYVSSASDSGDGSLRSILLQCNSGDTIMFNNDIDTVTLTSGELIVSKSISIIGKQEMTVLKRSNDTLAFRIMEIISDDTLDVLIENLVITGGKAPAGTVDSPDGEQGGGIYIGQDYHRIYLDNCLVKGNSAGDGYYEYAFQTRGDGGDGGGIYSASFLSMDNCTITENTGGAGNEWLYGSNNYFHGADGGSGGGIYSTNELWITYCDFIGNDAMKGKDANSPGIYNDCNGGNGGSGGGIYNRDGLVYIMNCNFTDNSSGMGGKGHSTSGYADGGDAGHGGALYVIGGEILLDSVIFFFNKTGDGGRGASNNSGSSGSGGNGGAIYFSGNTFEINNSSVCDNISGNGGFYGEDCHRGGNGGSGGGAWLNGNIVKIQHCLFENNRAGNAGYCYGEGQSYQCYGGSGGGIMVSGITESFYLVNSSLKYNSSGNGGKGGIPLNYQEYYQGGSGGGICINSSSGSLMILNSLISGNYTGVGYLDSDLINYYDFFPHSGNGGGISTDTSTISLINITCAGNRTGISRLDNQPISINDTLFDDVLGLGGGIYAPDTGLLILNSIISDNTIADTLVGNDIAAIAGVNYSLVRDSSRCEISGGNNIFNTDPVFSDFPDSLALTIFSPGVNAGNPDTSFLGLPPTDLAGNPRIFNGLIDMGAYELQEVNYYQSLLINVSPVKFDSVAPGSSSGEEVSIINDGTLPVTIDYISCHSPFALWDAENMVWIDSLNQFTIMPGEPGNRFILQLSFSPQTAGYYTDSLSIMSDLGLIKIQLSGVCGFEEIDEYKPQMAIFPNPADHSINIMFKKPLSEDVSIQLFNQLGRQVNLPDIKELSGKSKINISVRDLPGGIYFIRLVQEEVIAEAKIIIMH